MAKAKLVCLSTAKTAWLTQNLWTISPKTRRQKVTSRTIGVGTNRCSVTFPNSMCLRSQMLRTWPLHQIRKASSSWKLLTRTCVTRWKTSRSVSITVASWIELISSNQSAFPRLEVVARTRLACQRLKIQIQPTSVNNLLTWRAATTKSSCVTKSSPLSVYYSATSSATTWNRWWKWMQI